MRFPVPEIASHGASPAPLVHEIKYVMPAASAGPAEAWLNAVCRPEVAYPPAWVCSVYVDRPDGALLDEKINSDYLKTKVRIRWYEPLVGAISGPAYLEIKQRAGTSREKHRVALSVPAAELASWTMADPRWLPLLAPASGIVSGPLGPVLRMRYVRTRFFDRLWATRVALDRSLTVTAVHPALRPGPLPALAPWAVFEWKGPNPELSPTLRGLASFGAHRRAFSKYLAGMLAGTR
jgi:hypothetical protein